MNETIGLAGAAEEDPHGLPQDASVAAAASTPSALCNQHGITGVKTRGSDVVKGAPSIGATTSMLAPGWAARLAQRAAEPKKQVEPVRVIPLATEQYEGSVTFVTDLAGAKDLVSFARQRAIAWVGIDFEYRFAKPGVFIKRYAGKDQYWNDPLTHVPLLLAVTLAEQTPSGDKRWFRFVVDCRVQAAVLALADLFRLPLTFVGHSLRAELMCLWQLGLPIPARIWDTWVAEKALFLGVFHAQYKTDHRVDDQEEAKLKEESEAESDLKFNLPACCIRRGISYAFSADKERLQRSFLDHAADAPFSQEQIDYNSADAVAAAALYAAQIQAATASGCLSHLIEVEMPWTITNSRMIWDGARVDVEKCKAILTACVSHEERISAELRNHGLDNVNSHPQMVNCFRKLQLLDPFRLSDGFSFSDDRLEQAQSLHPVIPLIRLLRKIRRLQSDRSLSCELIGVDGRLHPEHRQFGAESGRNSMRWPNIGGIGRALRPVIVPEAGFGIGEVDLSQIEVGIAAAVYNDSDLINMFNGRDVYTAMAKSYYAAELSVGETELPDQVFKKQHRSMRDRMKIFTLATIYNITPFGLSLRLGITEQQATTEQTKFLDMFPAMGVALQEASAYGAIRGHAYLCSGLRRLRARPGQPTSWETNWMRNSPVQGSACVVFKTAGNRLCRRFQHYSARLILPMHDAFVFEAPLAHFATVAAITAEVMKGCVQESFPMLDPQVDINVDHPECWNKDGDADSLARWLDDPTGGL